MKLIKFTVLILFVFLFALPQKGRAEIQKTECFSDASFATNLPDNLNITAGDANSSLSKNDVLTWFKKNTDLVHDSETLSEIENTDLCLYEKSFGCRLTFPYSDYGHIKKVCWQEINKDAVARFIKDLAQKINRNPENAKLEITNGKVSVFSMSRPGIRLDEEKSIRELENYLSGNNYAVALALPADEIQPDITTASANNLGINTLIGQGTSNFSGSPKNRIFNINVATARFNGVLIKPDEEFSFVKNLGEVDGKHGYKPELVIKNNVTEPEFGGGICQVSTTAFRAAINSGLKITARKNHAYPVQYYNPQGMDATVYIPKPDLQFVNNTPGYILIETKIDGTQLIFNFYGTDDGRKVNVIGPKILSRGSDGSMKATFTQEVLDKEGNIIRQDVFNSAYNSPNRYPHPGAEIVFTEKPDDWSKKQWGDYKKIHNL